ncbi:MAG: phosphatase PAP2 family protein [Legionellales bacterium]|nr:phosphatase PAP2 family protein [Legionellales bacterium]
MNNIKNDTLRYLVNENSLIFLVTTVSILINIIVIHWVPENINLMEKFIESCKNDYQHFIFATLLVYCILFGINKLYPKIDNIKKTTEIKNVISSVISSILIFICIFNFTTFKHAIPLINPFSWDPLLFKVDKLLLLNNHPAQLIQTLLPLQNLKYISNMFYASWGMVSVTILLWQNISPKRKLRTQFLLSWMLSWVILGSICALIFSSVGPCFYDTFYTSTPKDILLSNKQLQQYPVDCFYLTDAVKEALVQVTQSTSFTTGFGISAFPSLHVAISALNAIIVGKFNKYLGYLGWVYVFITSLSCVYLGFHYLVDCIAGVLGACSIWVLTGIVLNKKNKKVNF